MITCLRTSSGQTVTVAGARIAEPDARADATLLLGDGHLRPGLINGHDHLHRNHYPRLGSGPYRTAYEWGRDIHERCAGEIARARALDRSDALWFGALKNLLGGATTVVHHDRVEADFGIGFPVRVAPVRNAHSVGLDPAGLREEVERRARDADGGPFCIHLAEGTGMEDAGEIEALDRLGLVNRSLLGVHLVGADRAGVERLERAGAGAVWCPTSNFFLFDRTAPRALFDSGVDVLLGSDSLLTGAGTLLDELRFAAGLGCLSQPRLLDAVGATAARRLGLPDPSMSPGAPADLVLLRRSVLVARPRDVALVMVGGKTWLADEDLADAFDPDAGPLEGLMVGGVRKRVPARLVQAAERALACSPTCGRILQ